MKLLLYSITLLYLLLPLTGISQQPFTSGNIVVYRVGDGSSVLTFAAAKVYLDEYTPNGALVQSILMPTSTSGSNKLLTSYGNQISNGMMNLSADGKYLLVPGVDVALGSTNDATAAVIGLIDFNGKVNTSTAVGDYFENDNIPRTAISNDGSSIWLGGFGAIRYTTAGSSTSVKLNSSTVNDLKITDGQLYASVTTTAQMVKVGSGLPTTAGQTVSGLPGISATSDTRQFAFVDLDENIPGSDVLYVSDRNSGIIKYSLVSGVWTKNGVVGTAADNYIGLTARATGSTVTVFATRKGPNTSFGGELIKLIDNSGYNGALAANPLTIATVSTPNTMMLRGVARVPLGCPSVSRLRVPDISATQANIYWDASGGTGYEYAITNTALPPASGIGTSNNFVNATGLISGSTYYVHVRTKCGTLSTSEWSSVSFITGCSAPALSIVNINVSNAGLVAINWNHVFGAAGYEYSVSTTATPPAYGTATNDTSVSVKGLNAVTKYYFHLRSNCGAGIFSSWTTKPFSTGCFMPAITLSVLPKNAGASWTKVPNAIKYEYALTYSAAKPLSGSYTIDTSYLLNQLLEGTAYYFHLRAICSAGVISEWNTVPFDVQGLQAYPNPVNETLFIKLNGITNPSGEIFVADATGRVKMKLRPTGSSVSIDTKGWATGIYFLRYSDEKQKYIIRILKQ